MKSRMAFAAALCLMAAIATTASLGCRSGRSGESPVEPSPDRSESSFLLEPVLIFGDPVTLHGYYHEIDIGGVGVVDNFDRWHSGRAWHGTGGYG